MGSHCVNILVAGVIIFTYSCMFIKSCTIKCLFSLTLPWLMLFPLSNKLSFLPLNRKRSFRVNSFQLVLTQWKGEVRKKNMIDHIRFYIYICMTDNTTVNVSVMRASHLLLKWGKASLDVCLSKLYWDGVTINFNGRRHLNMAILNVKTGEIRTKGTSTRVDYGEWFLVVRV